MSNLIAKLKQIDLNSYKVYQTLGWMIYYFAELTITFSVGKLSVHGFLIVTLLTLLGVSLTSLMRIHYRTIDFKNTAIFNIIFMTAFFAIAAALIQFFIEPFIYILAGLKIKLESYYEVEQIFRRVSYYVPIYFGWGILYFSIKFWLERENQRKIAEKASVLVQNTQFQMLRYHLNPHFLFNALNSIRALIDEDPQNSRKLITELSEYLRYSLISRNKPSVSLREEMDAVRHYLSVEKQRYEEKLYVQFQIDNKSEEIQVPSFVIQPLIENAIKFGMKTSKMPMEIIIKANIDKDDLMISVINSGKWIEPLSAEYNVVEHGIDSVNARMRNFFGERFVFDKYENNNYVYVMLRIIFNGRRSENAKV